MYKILMMGETHPENINHTTLQLLSLANGFGHDVKRVELIIPHQPPLKVIAPFIKNKNIKIHRKMKWYYLGWHTLRTLIHTFKNRFDIIYIKVSPYDGQLIALLRLIAKAHLVCYLDRWASQEAKLNGRPSWLIYFLKKRQLFVLKRAHSIHVPTLQFKTLLINHGIAADKIFHVGNGVDCNKIYPLNHQHTFKKLNLDPHFFYVGFIGSVHKWQGLACALQAIAIIKKTKPFIKLIIAGDGPALSHIKSLTQKLELTEEVIFFNTITLENANLLLNAFDLAIAPFTLERNHLTGLAPLKICSYAAAGRPTIAADLLEIQPEEDPELLWLRLFSADNDQALAQTILDLIDQSALRKTMGLAARQYAEKYYPWTGISKKVLAEINLRLTKQVAADNHNTSKVSVG